MEYPQWLCHEADDCAGLVQLKFGGDAGLALQLETQAPGGLQFTPRLRRSPAGS